MKPLGIVRKIDSLGRIVIPKEVRRANSWGVNQPMEMFLDGENLVMRAYGEDMKRQELVDKLKGIESNNPDENIVIDDVIAYLKGE